MKFAFVGVRPRPFEDRRFVRRRQVARPRNDHPKKDRQTGPIRNHGANSGLSRGLLATLKIRGGRFLFPSRVHEQPHISTRQYARIVQDWVRSAGHDGSAYGTHSMRRTKAAQIYKKTGNLGAVQLLLGHTKLESTVRYLGIEVDDALSISRQVEL
jgi:integrase